MEGWLGHKVRLAVFVNPTLVPYFIMPMSGVFPGILGWDTHVGDTVGSLEGTVKRYIMNWIKKNYLKLALRSPEHN